MKKKVGSIKHLGFDGVEVSWFAPLCDGDDDFLGTIKFYITNTI